MTQDSDKAQAADGGSGQRLLPYGLVAFCFLLGVISRGVNDCFPLFVPAVEAEFKASRGDVTPIFGLVMLVIGCSGPLLGILLDRFGPRLLAISGLVVMAGGGILASQATELWHLHVALGLAFGLGCAALGNMFHAAVLGRWFTSRLGTVLGIAASSAGVGVMLLAPVAELLISAAGWRQAWLTFGVATAAAIPLVLLLPWRRIAAGDIRHMQPLRHSSVPSGRGPTMGEAVRRLPFWGFVICYFGTSGCIFSLLPQIVALLVARGYTPSAAAQILAITGFMTPLGMVGFNWLADRGGRTFSAAAAYACTAAGIVALWMVNGPSDVVAVGAFAVLFGSTMGSRGPMISTLATLRYRGAHLGGIFGLISCGMGIGAAAGAWAGGVLHDVTGGYDAVLALAFVSLIIGAIPLVWEARSQAR